MTIPNSRTSEAAAGWREPGRPRPRIGTWPELMRGLPDHRPVSWFNPRVLWACRNDRLARLSDPVPFERSRWVGQLAPGELVVDLRDRHPGAFSFLLMGDTGEGDNSQYAVAPVLGHHEADTAFLLICSDVQYPVGDVNDYERKFYRPYADFHRPIYALPGNHDWYDDLAAFQFHFGGHEDAPPRTTLAEDLEGTGHGWWKVLLRRRFWHRPPPPDLVRIALAQRWRAAPDQQQQPAQPAPYYVIDAGPVRLVCIDTGILGDIDERQARWLLEVSRDPRPKLLLTGKPLLVDGEVHGCTLHGRPEGFATVLDVVHHAPFRYLGSIGGDIHNYQRYPVTFGGRQYQHIVSGGGGAFMHATHLIDSIDGSEIHDDLKVTEEQFRCYPLRLDSLAVYSEVLDRMLRRWHLPGHVALTPAEAAAIVYPARHVDMTVKRDVVPVADVPRFKRFVGHWVLRVGGQRFHKWFSPFFDWDTPPFFRHFLRLDVSGTAEKGSVTVTCLAVTGLLEQELQTPAEDTVTMAWGT